MSKRRTSSLPSLVVHVASGLADVGVHLGDVPHKLLLGQPAPVLLAPPGPALALLLAALLIARPLALFVSPLLQRCSHDDGSVVRGRRPVHVRLHVRQCARTSRAAER